MAKVYKIELYAVDINGEFDDDIIDAYPEYVRELADDSYFANIVKLSKLEASDEFEWEDSLAINKILSTNEDFEEYFRKEES